MTVIAPAS